MSPAISRRTCVVARAALGVVQPTRSTEAALAELERALKPKRRTSAQKATQKAKATKKASKREETASIRKAVFERASGCCENLECAAGASEMDHFRGRRRSESVASCWALCGPCHYDKTHSRPSAAAWLNAYRTHCLQHGYDAEANWALLRKRFVTQRNSFGSEARP